jgi:hypothetical protein
VENTLTNSHETLPPMDSKMNKSKGLGDAVRTARAIRCNPSRWSGLSTSIATAGAILLGGCEERRTCGTVLDKYQRGRFNEMFKVVVQSKNGPVVVDATEIEWAQVQRGENICISDFAW